MAIIVKPSSVYKGVEATFSLSKNELAGLSIVFNDSFFSDTNNWQKINVNFKSSTGNQTKTVEFDATVLNPTGSFFASEKARDIFLIESIHIVDFDLQVFIVPRSALNTAEFDIELDIVGGVEKTALLLEDGQTLLTESGETIVT